MQGPREGSGAAEPISDLNVIPFIDICLVLLIIVLVTASFSTKLLGFDHPQAAPGEGIQFVEAAEAVTIDVDKEGKCTIAGKTVAIEDLKPEVQGQANGGAFPPFVLRASREVTSQKIVQAVGEVRAAGDVNVSFAVRE